MYFMCALHVHLTGTGLLATAGISFGNAWALELRTLAMAVEHVVLLDQLLDPRHHHIRRWLAVVGSETTSAQKGQGRLISCSSPSR